jgi:hypothetical protein
MGDGGRRHPERCVPGPMARAREASRLRRCHPERFAGSCVRSHRRTRQSGGISLRAGRSGINPAWLDVPRCRRCTTRKRRREERSLRLALTRLWRNACTPGKTFGMTPSRSRHPERFAGSCVRSHRRTRQSGGISLRAGRSGLNPAWLDVPRCRRRTTRKRRRRDAPPARGTAPGAPSAVLPKFAYGEMQACRQSGGISLRAGRLTSS